MKNIFNQIKRFQNIDLQEGEAFSFTLPVNNTSTTNLIGVNPVSNDLDDKIYTNPAKMEINGNYKVTVKQYMTEPSSTTFDFQDKWNNGVPMPLCIMQGKVIKETRGMIYMDLTGRAEPSCRCFVCGKSLTNPVSKLYGIGPECSNKIGLIRIESEEEAREKWEEISNRISEIKWSGWIIKSAIKSWEEVNEED